MLSESITIDKSKILLVNFGEEDKSYFEKKGIEAHLGYLSEPFWPSGSHQVPKNVLFYSPLAIYEYKMIFINAIPDTLNKDTLRKKYSSVLDNNVSNIIKDYYLKCKGVIVIFLSNNELDSLSYFGIYGIGTTSSKHTDITIELSNLEKDEYQNFFKNMKDEIVIPLENYLYFTDMLQYTLGNRVNVIYKNLNDDILGVYYKAKDKVIPSLFILPGFMDNIKICRRILEITVGLDKTLIPELSSAAWIEGDEYYPEKVYIFDKQLGELKKEYENKTKQIEAKKVDVKKKFIHLKRLLTAKEKDLKDAVINVLSEIWRLEVVDMDKDRKTNFKEDLLIKYKNFNILAEVKGTKNKNPTLKFVTQVLTNLLKSEYDNKWGCLILNHDLTENPINRTLAYSNNEEEEALSDIIFIDTRILFYLSIAIVDYGLNLEEAKTILFQKGRVKFDLGKHISNKERQN